MIWIEQPVGVGYSQGTPNITNEIELAAEFRGFWKNFISTFDMQTWDVYVTGESYAGFYVPYIADSFISANDTEYFNLKGIAINDPIIGDETNQQQGKTFFPCLTIALTTPSCCPAFCRILAKPHLTQRNLPWPDA